MGGSAHQPAVAIGVYQQSFLLCCFFPQWSLPLGYFHRLGYLLLFLCASFKLLQPGLQCEAHETFCS